MFKEDRTRVCCIRLGKFVIRSERLFDSGDSWFSAKAIKVVCFLLIIWGKVTISLGGFRSFDASKTNNTY